MFTIILCLSMMVSSPFEGFSATERRNLTIYMIGIMSYKFALETLTGCMASLVLTRTHTNPSAAWAMVVSISYAMQSIGSLLVSPLIKRWYTHKVLSCACFLFGMLVLIIPVLEFLTGGGRDNSLGDEKKYLPGHWPIFIVTVLFPVCGVLHGVIELVRRVIPKDLVGDNVVKLKKLDSAVHIGYELAGAIGAFLSTFWIAYFSYAYSVALIPIMFTMASMIWWQMVAPNDSFIKPSPSSGVVSEIRSIFRSFFYSVWVGFKLVMMNRSLIWLVFAYSVPLVMHRYLENVLFSQYANFALGRGSYQNLIVAGSNFGELLGALFVLIFSSAVPSPIPWLRMDAIALLVVWVLPLVNPLNFGTNLHIFVWAMAAMMVPVSFCWAAGDVSLVAYVQSRLAKIENSSTTVSPLGSVMSFLYVTYIILFAIMNKFMSDLQDSYVAELLKLYKTADGIPFPQGLVPTQQAMVYTAGVVMSVAGCLTMVSTFIPRGSFAWNPAEIESDFDIKSLSKQLGAPKNKDENYAYGAGDEKRKAAIDNEVV